MALTRSHSFTSNNSFLSSYPSTECDTTSESSTSTVPGPGALTGKALKALGTATLRGLGRIIMARHLAIVTHNFPHTEEQACRMRHIDRMYDNLLEFSRPGMYSEEISNRALGLILAQIGMGQTRYLIKALSRWHSVEMHILLSRILVQLTPLWNPSLRLVFACPLYHFYSKTQPWDHLSPIRLILFLSKIIRSSGWACRAVLDVGFLDVLLSICHNYGFNSANALKSSQKTHPLAYNYTHLLIACNAALLDITAYPEHRSLVARHPIYFMWPKHFINRADTLPFTTRREALMLGPDTDVTFDDHSPYITLSLTKVCAQPSISLIAADKLLESLTCELIHDQAIRVFLIRSSHQRKVTLLSQLVECMSKSLVETECNDGIRDNPSWRYQLLFSLWFITAIAPENRQALLDAGAANYLTRVLQMEFPDSYFSIIVDHGNTTNISSIIREHGLPGLLNTRGIPSSRIQCSLSAAFAALFEDVREI